MHIHGSHIRSGRPCSQTGFERVELRFVPLRLDLHTSICKIADPSRNSHFARGAQDEVTESYALNPAAYHVTTRAGCLAHPHLGDSTEFRSSNQLEGGQLICNKELLRSFRVMFG
jgi:hypothetical protein